MKKFLNRFSLLEISYFTIRNLRLSKRIIFFLMFITKTLNPKWNFIRYVTKSSSQIRIFGLCEWGLIRELLPHLTQFPEHYSIIPAVSSFQSRLLNFDKLDRSLLIDDVLSKTDPVQ